MPYVTARRRHRWLTTVAAAMRLVTPQLATESGLPSGHPQAPARWPDPCEMTRSGRDLTRTLQQITIYSCRD